jgi:hypothetical protein
MYSTKKDERFNGLQVQSYMQIPVASSSSAVSQNGQIAVNSQGNLMVSHNGSWNGVGSSSHAYYQKTKLVGLGAVGAPNEGVCSVSGDGLTIAVGGWDDNAGAGAVWIYVNYNGSWSQQGNKLVANDGVNPSNFGYSVALSDDGTTLAVGGRNDNGGIGAAWIFTRDVAGTWTQQGAKLVGTGYTGTPNMGYFVALSADGNTLAVGGPNDNTNIGATWVFSRSGSTWSQQGSLLIGSSAIGASFQGVSVALSSDGNTLAIGGVGDNAGVGAAWVFYRAGATWSEYTKVIGSEAIGGSAQGDTVSLNAAGNILAVGGVGDDSNAGAIWIFELINATWVQTATKLVGSGSIGLSQQGWNALNAAGDVLYVGGPGNNTNFGAVWVFTRSASGAWNQQGSKLIVTQNVGAPYLQQVSTDNSGQVLVVGGAFDNSNVGAAWVFE